MAKGGNYEREICTLLSQWWAGRDDVFWRTSGSGARATSRRKKGKATANSSTDVTFIDPCGRPLVELLTIEIKRGYSTNTKKKRKGGTIHDLLDRPKRFKEQLYEEFFGKTMDSARHAGTYSWAVIARRDQRRALIFMPMKVWQDLLSHRFTKSVRPFLTLFVRIRGKSILVVGMKLQAFLKRVSRKDIKTLWRKECK